MEYHLTTLFVLLLLNFSVGLQPADKAANAKTRATLDFIGGLAKQGMFIFDCILLLLYVNLKK
jgi:hypothetical protein